MSDEPESAVVEEDRVPEDGESLRREGLLAKVRELNRQSLTWPR